MASTTEASTTVQDPCAEFGPNQRWALVWFLAIVFGGIVLVTQFARMDSWMWENNADFMDWKAYKENRIAHTTIPSERTDHRSAGDYSTAAGDLAPDGK